MVRERTPEPYQPPRDAGSSLGSPDVCEGQDVRLKMDNKAAICYINHMGGTRSPSLLHTACQLWEWCLQRGTSPGLVQCDSRSGVTDTSVLSRVEAQRDRIPGNVEGPCRVDLFASRLNNQLPLYVSWRPDPFAMATDAFQLQWTDLQAYAFPPFALIGRCLQKIRQEQATVLLIAPVWPTQTWYPWLLEMVVHFPTLLPCYRGLLRDPFNREHPLLVNRQLHLAAWRVSGVPTICRAFQAEFQRLCQQGGGKGQTQPVSQVGSNGLAGVVRGLSIPFLRMSNTSWTS